ncbi:Protein ASPARTIC PROTEASE IN GUARD CELL 1 [Camellia lanceoleosa]|uniref:Protein ASPARTIC PROTEASE IN GUARD CELL 1 n=1 Tax=Camellia lanceoleosa TaxID=1840588 RepID=A0ACC0I2R1_9ERIC|nr:Protein ASPARTIC PROTEASE IN GUARD CELL 1 [Camellia lanceoleosa]
MAEKSLLSHILFVLAFCLYLHSALSRSLSSSESEEEHSHSHSHSHSQSQSHYTTTTVLDVSASIQRTLHLLSFHPQQQQQQQQQKSITVPSSSSSSSALEVSACQTDSCLYQVSYGDGSFTVGDFATEKLSFGNSGSVNNVAIGCGHDNEGLFIASAGLLGLGGGTLSLTSQLKASSFSYCLVDRDSTGSSSTLEFNSATPGDSVTAPLLRNSQIRTYRYVALTGMSVGGQPLALPPSVFDVESSGRGGVIVDSGTAVTRLKTQVYNSLRDSFAKMTQNLPSTSGFSIFDTCYDLSSKQTVSIPTVSFHFSGGETLRLRPQNYLIPVDSAGKFCFAFAPTDGSLSIIGNIQQQGTRVSYDLANSLVAFSPNKC